MQGLIFGGQLEDLGLEFDPSLVSIRRSSGGHKIATFLRRHGYDIDVVDYVHRWDIEQLKAYIESKVTDDKLVYKKSNEITKNKDGKIISHGATRAAQFYLVNKKSALKLYKNFLPFNHSADMWMNNVIKQQNLNVFWSEPSLVVSKFNKKTSTNVSKLDILYRIKSKRINKKLGI